MNSTGHGLRGATVALKTFPAQFHMMVGAKLGRCPRCMRLSIQGTVVAWGVVALLAASWPNSVALSLAALSATGLTLLALSHIIAFTLRVRSATRTLPAGSGFERREFLGLFIKVGVAAFAYSLSGGLGRASAAGNSACAHFCDAIFPP